MTRSFKAYEAGINGEAIISIRPGDCPHVYGLKIPIPETRPTYKKCPDCDGEGGHEIPTCGTARCKCDGFSGGCTEDKVCSTCEGECEVPVEPEDCCGSDDGEHCGHWEDELPCCYCGEGGADV